MRTPHASRELLVGSVVEGLLEHRTAVELAGILGRVIVIVYGEGLLDEDELGPWRLNLDPHVDASLARDENAMANKLIDVEDFLESCVHEVLP